MLTYMSIRDQIKALVASKELYVLESIDFGACTPRSLFVTKDVLDAVTYPFPEDYRVLHAEFRQTLDGFLEGGEMSVGDDPDTKASDALMARVKPVERDFFDFRITSPYPAIRAFGGFAEKDVFVIVSWQYRDVIGDDFDAEVSLCKLKWEKLFGRTPPFKGKSLNDHLSNFVSV
jgi:hypothetical protein